MEVFFIILEFVKNAERVRLKLNKDFEKYEQGGSFVALK